jgi:hypothetical protein
MNLGVRAKRDPTEAIFIQVLAASVIVRTVTDGLFYIRYEDLMETNSVLENAPYDKCYNLERYMLQCSHESRVQNETASVAFRLGAAYFNALKRKDVVSDFSRSVMSAIRIGAKICAEHKLDPWAGDLTLRLHAASVALVPARAPS